MLQFIRSKVTSIFIKVLFGILILSFAIWGIGDIFLGNKDGEAVISIGDKEYNALHFNFKSSDQSLPDNKKLNTDIWYEENTFLWIKAAFDKTGYWEYRLKKVK